MASIPRQAARRLLVHAKVCAKVCAKVYAKGLVMGACDVAPGVSGGTIAVTVRIYDRIILAFRAISAEAALLFCRGDWKACWRSVDGTFLLLLGLGIASGLLLGANLIVWLAEHWPEPLRAFFIGLIVATLVDLRDEASLGDWRNALAAFAGALFVLLVSLASPGEVEPSLAYLFFCGMIAVSAMLLPGLSGAFILLLLGAYPRMLTALAGLEIPVLLVFLCGCAIGALLTARIIAWLLRSSREPTYGFIRGMLASSVIVLWPWRVAGEGADGLDLLDGSAAWPFEYLELSGRDPLLFVSLASLCLGFALTLLARRGRSAEFFSRGGD